MIVEWLILALVKPAQWLLDFLPDAEALPTPNWALDQFYGPPLGILQAFIPYNVAVQCCQILLGWAVFVAMFRIVVWLLAVLHISGSSAT